MNVTVTARNILLAVFALMLLAVALPSTASAAVANPIGRLESVQTTAFSNTVVIIGWAVDSSVRSRPTSVLVTIDSKNSGGWRSAALLRTDVNKAYSSTGGHGFQFDLTPATGQHTVCVTARGGVSSTLSLGCFAFQAYPQATKAQMLAIAKTIDPKGTINWSWASLPTGTSGHALPWNKTIEISSSNTTRYLRAVMLHEWSHVLQYRAFGTIDPWFDAVQAFNALLGHPTDRVDYDGVEHGADCIALALGANYLGYGCPAALKVYGARIAAGTSMSAPTGAVQSTRVSRSSLVLTGWALDPSHPTTSSQVQVTDNGRDVTAFTTAGLNRTDINSKLGVTGGHGFQIPVTLSRGSHRLCVSAGAVAAGRPSATIAGCALVVIS